VPATARAIISLRMIVSFFLIFANQLLPDPA
jgi:hypothetical protein